ncbi:isocitrate/isopropylmalate family dehydrogenase, partial [Streptomyces sp. NPDC002643]
MNILVLPGDGIGPEITAATLDVLKAADKQLGLDLSYETHDIGLASLAASGSTLPEAVLERVPQADGVLLGPVSHYDYPPRAEGGINPSAELRTVFQL